MSNPPTSHIVRTQEGRYLVLEAEQFEALFEVRGDLNLPLETAAMTAL